MKKISLIICFCLIFVVLSSCSRKDLSEEAREAWRYAEAHGPCDQEGAFKCYSNSSNNIWSMSCTDGNWNEFEECPFACNETTGKCYDPGNPTDPNNPTSAAEACYNIYACYTQCGDDNCVQECLNNGSDEGLELFTGMVECFTNNCAGASISEITNDCLLNYCKKEIEDCNIGIDPASCTLDESILDDCSSSNYCFAFKGEGVINVDGSYSESYIDDAMAILLGFESDGKHLEYAQENSAFFSTIFDNSQAVELIARGDIANTSAGSFFTTVVETYIPIRYIDVMKAYGSDRSSFAPSSEVYDLAYSEDGQYLKRCLIAANRLDSAQPVGITQICYADNETFGVGETFKLAMRADLVAGQELLDLKGVVFSKDLCKCSELNSHSEVDCSVFDPDDINSDEPDEDEEIDDLPETPDDEPDNPCDLNPCSGVEHSTGVCNMEDSNNYSCECDDPCWFWDGEACIHDDSCGE